MHTIIEINERVFLTQLMSIYLLCIHHIITTLLGSLVIENVEI
jgi:hypothetical protein